MSNALMLLNYVMLVFLSMKTGSSWWILTVPVMLIIFILLWRVDDKKDVIGDEYIYNFFRSKPQTDVLVLLKRLDMSKRKITDKERNELRDMYLKKQ